MAKKKLPTGPGVSGAPKPNELVVPQAREQLRGLLLRLAIPVVGAWLLCGLLASIVYSPTWKIVLVSVPVIITLLAGGLIVFALRQTKKAAGVANILSGIETDDDRKKAIAQLETASAKNDPAAIFAKAQLELQEDPRKALATLERINLGKVLAPVADEARGQRSMIHLMLGEVSEARTLVSSIEIKRHQEPRTRAMLAAVCAEAWARSGEAQRALDTLKLFDPEDAAFEQLRPQLYRSYAYAYAHTNDIKGLRRMLKKLAAQDIRLLGGFMVKRTHPLLQKEAKKAIEQSGQVPRKMIVQRR